MQNSIINNQATRWPVSVLLLLGTYRDGHLVFTSPNKTATLRASGYAPVNGASQVA